MGRANREASAIFYDEDLSSQVVVTLEPEADYDAVPPADALAELSFRLSETKRDAAGYPSESGQYLLGPESDFVFYQPFDDEQGSLCLSVNEKGVVEILAKADGDTVYQGSVLGDALRSLHLHFGRSPKSREDISHALSQLLERYPD